MKRAERYLKALAKRQERGGSTIWTLARESDYEHPTQKPVELITHAINNSSRKGEVVADHFAGSGSTIIACEMAGRTCAAMEIDPKYAAISIARWEEFTSRKAKRIGCAE